MTVLVVDASVLVKAVVDEGDRDTVLDTFGDNDLVAPAFVRIELANILWKKQRLRHVTPIQAEHALDIIDRRALRLIDDRLLLPLALSLAIRIAHPVHDCLYMVAARQAGARLLTADRRLREVSASIGIDAWSPS